MSQWRKMRACTYNPLSENSSLRLEEIIKELTNHDLIALIWTAKRKHWDDADATRRDTDKHFGIAADWDRGAYTNKACGVHLFLSNEKFTPRMIRAIYTPLNTIRGR